MILKYPTIVDILHILHYTDNYNIKKMYPPGIPDGSASLPVPVCFAGQPSRSLNLQMTQL